MLEIIVRNSAKCLDCGDEIESKWGHDFRRCSCGHLAVDGGLEYTRRVYKEAGHWQDTSIFAEQPATKEDLAEARELLALANAGARPKPEVYARAPLLDDWRIVPARVPPATEGMQELEGYVYLHPDFKDGERIRTTPLLLRSETLGWARTMTRYWRLGNPAKDALN